MSDETKPAADREKALVKAAQNGDLDAFDALIRIHQDRIYHLALKLMRDREDALDLSQEVFLQCFRKLNKFRGKSKLSTWLYRVTVNLAKNAWRKRSRHPQGRAVSIDEHIKLDDGGEVGLQLEDEGPGPDKKAQGREIYALMEDKMENLPYEFREIIGLRHAAGLSYEEIADALEISLGTVKSRLYRARAELRKLMEPFL